jgi:hypothetical protein
MAWLSYRQLYDARQKAAAEHPQDQAALAMLEKLAADDPETRRRYEEERRYSAPGFSDYLAYRVSSLGVWPPPWPELFWGGELLLAGGLCAWVLARSRTACSTIPGESVMVK